MVTAATSIQIPEKPYLKSSEVADLFGVNHSTVFLWVKKGRLKPKRTLGGNFRFSRNQVMTLWEQHVRDGSSRENRNRPRFAIMCPVSVRAVAGEEAVECTGVVTDISTTGIGVRVEDDCGLMSLLRQQRIDQVEIRNQDHAVLRELVRGSVRHYQLVDDGDVQLGVQLGVGR